MSHPLIELQNITKDFPGHRALTDISLSFHKGRIHAIVGENGAGKSTLMKILSGVYSHGTYSGFIRIDGSEIRFNSVRDAEKAGIAIIHQELLLVKQISVAENIFLGREKSRFGFVNIDEMKKFAAEILQKYQFQIDAAAIVESLGIAQQQLVEIAKALSRQGRVLILDEPTAPLTDVETTLLHDIIRTLAKSGTTVVYISHKLEEVLSLADHISVLRDGTLVSTAPVNEWTRESLISSMVGRTLDKLFPRVDVALGGELLRLENLKVIDAKHQLNLMVSDISLSLNRGEIVGLAGLMGSGRTEILLTAFGASPGILTGGKIFIKGEEMPIRNTSDAIDAGIALVPEDRKNSGIIPDLDLLQNLTLVFWKLFSRFGLINITAARKKALEIARSMSVKFSSMDQTIGSLSGGNQQKIVLGKWFHRSPEIFLLDEPTRGIDVGARAEIYNLLNELKSAGKGILMVSSDLPEIIGMCDRVYVIREGKVGGLLQRDELTQERIMELAV